MPTQITEHQTFHEATVYVCAHRVLFFYHLPGQVSDDLKSRMTDEAEDRAKSQIIEGCIQGELNYETDDFQATGWWRIED